jgi:dipeptidyl aminopeptidase/acylaminoacyl peptidase
VTGEPVAVLPDALGVPPDGGGAGHVIAATGGVIAYLPGPMYPRRELAWIDKKGVIQPLKLPLHSPEAVALSPDGKRLAMTRIEGGTYEVWIQDLTRNTEDRLDVKGSNLTAVWGPRGEWLAFISERKGEYDAYIARPDGSGERVLLNQDYDEQPIAWTHDGSRILVREWRLDGTTPIISVDAANGGSPVVLLPNTPGGSGGEISPNDHWFVYPGARGSRTEVSLRSLSENGTGMRVSTDGGDAPLWSRDGSEIYFLNDNTIMAASFRESGGQPEIGVPHALLKLPEWTALYGVDADGRFLIGRLVDPAPQPGVRVVLNWLSSLGAKK